MVEVNRTPAVHHSFAQKFGENSIYPQERIYKTACNCESCIQNDHKQGQVQSVKQRKMKMYEYLCRFIVPSFGLAGWLDQWIDGSMDGSMDRQTDRTRLRKMWNVKI